MPGSINLKQEDTLNILFIASEADPFVKVGGLGDVAGSLPLAIHQLRETLPDDTSVDIRLAIPYYPRIKNQAFTINKIASFIVNSKAGQIPTDIYSTQLSGMTIYFVSGEPVDRNPFVYGELDADKFIYFSLACLQLPKALGWKVDILHAHDWHTAIAVYALRSIRRENAYLQSTRSILTLHNLPFIGAGSEEALVKYKIKPSRNKSLPPWGRFLPLPMGLAAADKIVAVSPTYAEEILTPGYGCDLQDFLKTRKSHLTGILNGIDHNYWNPDTDEQIAVKFDSKHLNKRKINKTELQKEFDLDYKVDVPLLIFIGRMDQQKGIDIILEGLRMIKDLPWQVILLGSGNPALEDSCRELEMEMPGKVRAAIRFDANLSRRMYAGGDILMMPSRYEPCGLAQMIAMRYGCIPLARATGGLFDSIVDIEQGNNGTGFLFKSIEPVTFSNTVIRAFATYHDKPRWQQIQLKAMSQDFSWKRSAEKYVELYQTLHMKSKSRGIK